MQNLKKSSKTTNNCFLMKSETFKPRPCKFFWGNRALAFHSSNQNAQLSNIADSRRTARAPPPVCWIGVKGALLCAQQYMSWNIFLTKVLNNFWYFEHPILTMIYSEAYLKHYWRNCLHKLYFFAFFRDNFFNHVSNMLSSKS